MSWEPGSWRSFDGLAGRLEPGAQDCFDAAVAAANELGPEAEGAVDDLFLLERFLDAPDELLLSILGSHFRKLRNAVGAERQKIRYGVSLPVAEDLLSVAATEAMSITGGDTIEQVHIVLAMFSFPGCGSEQVLQACGIDWRPLRSLARRAMRRGWDW